MIYVCTLAIIGRIDILDGSVPLDLPCTFPTRKIHREDQFFQITASRCLTRLFWADPDPALTAGSFCN